MKLFLFWLVNYIQYTSQKSQLSTKLSVFTKAKQLSIAQYRQILRFINTICSR